MQNITWGETLQLSPSFDYSGLLNLVQVLSLDITMLVFIYLYMLSVLQARTNSAYQTFHQSYIAALLHYTECAFYFWQLCTQHDGRRQLYIHITDEHK